MNPFANQNSKIMQLLIKRYPVVFPDADTKFNQDSRLTDTIGQMDEGGLREEMPHEFHDLLRDLLIKDPSERLGSECFLQEISTHTYFQTY
jgi:hypothetical protein